uniref:Pickpocket n=1 Tax=Anopheles minimus TaxID=112268 RepID=A0A182WLX8_9DIPT
MKYLGTRCNTYGRSFWVVVLCGSFASMILILLFTIDTYDDTISVNPDTSYLRWNSTFPAISLCYAKGRTNQISNFLKEQWASSNFTPAKRSCNNTNYLWPKMAQTYLFVSPNSNLDEDITALCAGLNSTCNLNLKVMKNRMYIHSPEDYPNFVEPFYALRKSGFVSHFMLQITETVNKPEVKDEPIDKRKCKFPEERLSPVLAYSFSQCFLYNRIKLELKLCNCTIPTSPKAFSLGGIGGLFFGVSLISIIELVYNMFFKPYHLKVKFSVQ